MIGLVGKERAAAAARAMAAFSERLYRSSVRTSVVLEELKLFAPLSRAALPVCFFFPEADIERRRRCCSP